MSKRMLCLLLVLLIAFSSAACGEIRKNPAVTEAPASAENAQSYVSVSYYGYYTDNEFLPEEIQQSLDDFGNLMWIEPSLQTETYTEIPQPENNAKGLDPVFVVLPELDPGKYKGPYIWEDHETGWEISAAYREAAGMLTDELVKVSIDDSGNICQYETVNLGRYDQLELNDRQLESARLYFAGAIQKHLGTVTREFYNSRQQHAPSAYRLFMDTEGNLVLCTTAVLTENAGSVELYAILKMGNLYK